jgi:hypothetical protein
MMAKITENTGPVPARDCIPQQMDYDLLLNEFDSGGVGGLTPGPGSVELLSAES